MNLNFFPRGYNSPIGGPQITTSGLQRQPVSQAVGSAVLARSPIVCFDYKTSTKRKRQVWSNEEDSVLMDCLRKESGSKIKWTGVARRVNKRSGDHPRTGKQCRERWQNHLRPNIKKGNWSKDEVEMIETLYETFGAQWSSISKLMKNRTDNDIKNKWNSMQRSLHLKKARRAQAKPDSAPALLQLVTEDDKSNKIDPSVLAPNELVVSNLGDGEKRHEGNEFIAGEDMVAPQDHPSSPVCYSELGLNMREV